MSTIHKRLGRPYREAVEDMQGRGAGIADDRSGSSGRFIDNATDYAVAQAAPKGTMHPGFFSPIISARLFRHYFNRNIPEPGS